MNEENFGLRKSLQIKEICFMICYSYTTKGKEMKRIILMQVFIIIILGNIFSLDIEKIKQSLEGKKTLQQIMILEKYIKENQKIIDLYILKSEIELKERDYLGSRDTLVSALSIEQNNIEVLNLLGISYFYLNQIDKAEKTFNFVLKLDNSNSLALCYLSILNPLSSKVFISEKDEKNETDDIDIRKMDSEYSGSDKNDYVYLLNKKEVEVIDSGKFNYTIHCVIKILSGKGADYFREMSYAYNGYEYYPEVIKAGSYDKNYNFNEVNRKNVVLIDKKTSNEVSLFTNRRFVAFPIPDINNDSIIEFKIKFNTTNKNHAPKIFDQFLFSGNDRCLKSEYVIKYSKDININIYKRGTGIELSENIKNDMVYKTFIYNNPPVYDLKNESLTIFDLSSQILISTFNSWDEVAYWYYPIFDSIIKTGTIAKDILSKLEIDKISKTERLDRIYQYIQKNINYVAIELDESAFRPHNPDEIYKNKFGDCKDQTMFFIYLLREAGIKAFPVLISTIDNGQIEKKVPSPFYFNHMITYIPLQDGIESEVFCDTTSGVTQLYNLPALDQGVSVFVIGEDKKGFFKDTPVIDSSLNRIEESYKAEIKSSGDGTLYFSEDLKGAYSEMIRYSIFNKTKEDAIEYLYNYQKKTYANLKKEDLEIAGIDNASGDLKISLKSYDKSLTNIYFDGSHKISFSVKDLGTLLNIPSKVKYDYTKNFLFSYKKSIEYLFPEGYMVTDGNTKNFVRENQYFKFETGSKFISDNNFILFFEITFKERVIKNDDIEKTKEFISAIEKEIITELVVKKEKDFDYVEFYDNLLNIYGQKEVYENYIRKMISLNNLKQAQKICEDAIKKYDKESEFYLIKANILIENNQMEDAESLLNNYLSINDNDVNVYIYLNEIYKKSETDEKLELNLKSAIEKFPNNDDFVLELINYYNRKEMFNESVELIKKSIEKNPNNSALYGNLGYTYSLNRDFINAEAAFLKSIELDNKNAASLNNLAWLYCENDTKILLAIEYSKKAVLYEPLNDSYLDTLAEAYFKNKEYDKAIETIKKAIKINPNYTYLQQQLDKIEKAKRLMEK